MDKEIYILAELLGRNDPKVKSLVWTAGHNPKMQGMVRNLLRSLARERGIDPENLPVFHMPHELSPSDYPLGRARCGEALGEEVGLSQEDLQGGGIGFFGIAGQGKTTLVKLFILQFLGKKL